MQITSLMFKLMFISVAFCILLSEGRLQAEMITLYQWPSATPITYDLIYETDKATIYVNTDTWQHIIFSDFDFSFFSNSLAPNAQYVLAYRSNNLCIFASQKVVLSCLLGELSEALIYHIYWAADSESLWLAGSIEVEGAGNSKIWHVDTLTGEIIHSISYEVLFPNFSSRQPILRSLSPSNELGIFTSVRSEEIYVIDLISGTLIANLTNDRDTQDYFTLNFSPSGDFMAALSSCIFCTTHFSIWDTETYTQTITDLIIDGREFYGFWQQPEWSHDGEYIAFVAITDNAQKPTATILYTVETRQLAVLTENNSEGVLINWSPDDQMFSQLDCSRSVCEVSVISRDGEVLRSWYEQGFVHGFAWLPRDWFGIYPQ